MSETYYSFGNLSLYDRSKTREKLEKMAQKGWMIEKLGAFLWKYKSIEPQKLHFEVVFLPGGSAYDAQPTDAECQLEELCEQDGWKRAVRWGQIQIFYNEQPDPAPIETDALTQVENIRRTVKKSLIPAQIGNLVLGAYLFGLSLWQIWSNPAMALVSPAFLLDFFLGLELFGYGSAELIRYFLWYRKALRMAENGEFYETHTGNWLVWLLCAVNTVTLLICSWGLNEFLLLSIGIVAAVVLTQRCVTNLLKRRKVSRKTNRNITIGVTILVSWVLMIGMVLVIVTGDIGSSKPVKVVEENGWEREIYADELVLRLEDFTEIPEDAEWSTRKDGTKSILASRTDYEQVPADPKEDLPMMHYSIIKTRFDWVKEQCKKGILKKYQDRELSDDTLWIDYYDSIDAAPWHAQQAYARMNENGQQGIYLLCYENGLVELRVGSQPHETQMEKIGAVLAEELAG